MAGRQTSVRGAKKKVAPVREGLKKLGQEADKKLDKNCNRILTALTKNAVNGSIGSAKLLVQLADREDPESSGAGLKKMRESAAAQWAKELEARYPSADSSGAEPGGGPAEPEV